MRWHSGVLGPLGWQGAAVGAALVLAVRPAAGLLALAGTGTDRWERGAIAFFGIRGIGSIYYLAHGLNQADFDHAEQAWALVAAVVVASVVVHGVLSTPVIDRLRARGEA